MRVLENLKPEKVFYYFEEICKIPHGSQNLDGISSYLEQFAKDRNLFCIRDHANNVIMIKEATPGYEDVEPVIMQGHMDMVAVKKPECDIDLEKDPLRLKIDGDYLYAEGTSLGGDDGIAVAYILAIFDDDSIAHPRIEAVITTDEEIGMEGATVIDLSMLTAKRMMNIDSEEEGILLASCAGGARVDCKLPVSRENKKGDVCLISVTGLTGGHSGAEIDKERANAIKLLGRALYEARKSVCFQLLSLEGGEKDNAIPREASAKVMTDSIGDLQTVIAKINDSLKKEYQTKEMNLLLNLEDVLPDAEENVLTLVSTDSVIDFLLVMPNGIQAMSKDIKGLVETSLNVGILSMNDSHMIASSAVRSSIETAKKNVIQQLSALTKVFGGEVSIHGEYPGWQFDPDSKLRATMVEVYREMFHEEVKVEAIHAGLECGIMISKIPGLDCVSFGPNMFDIHTTEERLSISSTERMWNYIIELLKRK